MAKNRDNQRKKNNSKSRLDTANELSPDFKNCNNGNCISNGPSCKSGNCK